MLHITDISKSFGSQVLLDEASLHVRPGMRVGLVGPNGAGKTTLLRCLMGELALQHGELKWAEAADIGYYAQDHAADFAEDMSLFDWMTQWKKPSDDEQAILDRNVFGRLAELLDGRQGVAGPKGFKKDTKITRALRSDTRMEFSETPLSQVARYLTSLHGAPVRAAHSCAPMPVTMNLKGISLEQGLDATCLKLGLTWDTDGKSIEIGDEPLW